jgi:hypothetical protein
LKTKEKIEVIQAYLDGKQIQVLDGGNWVDYIHFVRWEPVWQWGEFDYRVKPVPEEIYLVTGHIFGTRFFRTSESEAKEAVASLGGVASYKKYREVIE